MPTSIAFPSATDLQVEARPILDPAALSDDRALNDYEVEVEAWGARGWSQVGRLCRWAMANGMPGLGCEAPR